MALQVTNYQCPACTGPLRFDSDAGKLVCDYCENIYTPTEIEALFAEKNDSAMAAAELDARNNTGWDLSSAGGSWSDEEAASIRAYSCPSCGAEIICDQNTAATSCAHCGNPTIVPGRLGGALKPDLVIPFKLDKAAAIKALKRHYRKKIFLPAAFSSANVLAEIKGIYVPFWLFDCSSYGKVTFRGSRVRTYTRGDYRITETKHYRLHREGGLAFDKVPVDASTKMPDEHMDAIEPYNYAELLPFSTAYLPGYLADKYDIKSTECARRADKRIENSTVDMLSSTVHGYSSVSVYSKRIDVKKGNVSYALLPVWLLTTKWKDQSFTFAMNGQTGKFVGNLPFARWKYWVWAFVFALPGVLFFLYLSFFA